MLGTGKEGFVFCIHTLPTDPPKTPTMTVFVEPEGGLQGILDCRVDSEPPASLTLHLSGRLVASSQPQGVPAEPHIHVSASPNALRLSIEELLPSNQGEYVCSASNALGSASTSAYFGTRGEWKGLQLPGCSAQKSSFQAFLEVRLVCLNQLLGAPLHRGFWR
jgi:hypothetical protein